MKEINPIERTSMFWASNDASWHTADTLAAVADLSTNTLMNWRAQGRGPIFVKSGKFQVRSHVRPTFPTLQWVRATFTIGGYPSLPHKCLQFAYDLPMSKEDKLL